MKKAFFLLIAAGIFLSQFSPSTQYLVDEEPFALISDLEDNEADPVDPMEEYPEESESEDSTEKDSDKKWQQHRLLTKMPLSEAKTSWSTQDARQIIQPYLSKIQQPPEGSFLA